MSSFPPFLLRSRAATARFAIRLSSAADSFAALAFQLLLIHYRQIMTGWFEKEGSRVLAAENGVAALELLQKKEVNAIVTHGAGKQILGAE